jgi:hypothetical protein
MILSKKEMLGHFESMVYTSSRITESLRTAASFDGDLFEEVETENPQVFKDLSENLEELGRILNVINMVGNRQIDRVIVSKG